jgi:dynein heavy chain, axonemal
MHTLQVANLFKRLDNEGSYLREMTSDVGVQHLLACLNDALADNEASAEALRGQYDRYSYLWRTPMDAHFAAFVEDAVVVTALGQRLTDTRKFEEAIRKYEGVQAAVKQLASPQDVGWLRVNVTPMKQALLTWSAKWAHLFTSHLQRSLVSLLRQLGHFKLKLGLMLETTVSLSVYTSSMKYMYVKLLK